MNDDEENLDEISKSLYDMKKYYSPLNNNKENKDNIIQEINELNKTINSINDINIEKDDEKSNNTNSSIESLCPKDTNIYLKVYDWSKYNIDEKGMNKIIKNVIKNEEIIEFKKKLEKMNLTGPDCDEIILFSNIGYLNEFINENEICTTKKNKKNIMYRKIKGDGNCYHRSIMFALIENLILNKNITYIKNIFVNFIEKSKNKILITMFKALNINIEIFKKCFIMIYLSLISKSRNPVLKTYLAFIKLINNYKDFDYGLIIFFKFILYEYININKNSTYSYKFQIPLGNLLPNDCQDDSGKFNFNFFYKNYLMKFYQYAEKIIIYLTPFIFGKEILIKYINENEKDEFDINIQELQFGNNLSIIEFDTENKIRLIYKKMHYDILYGNDYYNKYKNFFKICLLQYINNFHFYICQICKKNDQSNSALIKLESDAKKIHEDNVIIICYKCLYEEIKQNLMSLYISFIKKIKKYFLENFCETFHDFLNQEFTLSNGAFNITYKHAIKILSLYRNKYTYEYIMNRIKQEICICCTNNIDKNKLNKCILLPCGCLLCNEKCVNEFYYLLISSAYIKQEFICFCKSKYTLENCLYLIGKLNEKKFDCKKLIHLLFGKMNKNICFLCTNKIKEISIEYLLIEPKFYLNRIIQHYVCEKCFKENNNNYIGQNIECQICKRNHIIEKINEKIKENIPKGYNFEKNDENNKIKIKNKEEMKSDIYIKKNRKNNKLEKISNNNNLDDIKSLNNDEEEKVTVIKIHKKKKNNNDETNKV